MRLSNESTRVRWAILVAVWIGVVVHVGLHTFAVRDYLAIADRVGLRGAAAAPTPLTNVYPSFAADAQTWVRHALSLLEGDAIRLRFTTIDNAPAGRDVHWNSMWAWALAGSGWTYHWIFGVSLQAGVEQAALWLPPAALLLFVILVSSWAARHLGVLGGAWFALALSGNARLSEGFFPKYADHHGLLSVAALGVVLGITVAGGGWWRPRTGSGRSGLFPDSVESVRAGAVFSALCGAFGLWVSAASVIPPVAIVGIAGLGAALICGRAAVQSGARFDPQSWRLWGRVGGGCSLGFYLLEYFPNHLSVRLEANHPVYALAWWGGGELIALIGEKYLQGGSWMNLPWRRFVVAVGAVAVAPLCIVILGSKAFVVFDPFLNRLHNDYIQEFMPLWKPMFGSGWQGMYMVFILDMLPFFVGVALLAVGRFRVPLTVWYSILVSGTLLTMGWLQGRWLLNAGGALCCSGLVLLAFAGENMKRVWGWLAVGAVATVFYLVPPIQRVVNAREDLLHKRVSPRDAHYALARDIAGAIRASQPQGEITLLSSPNSSSTIGYYGRFKTLGTLYWENSAGLKAAAMIYAAHGEQEAAKLVKKFGVTHIALVTEENFIGPYYKLMHPDSKPEDVQKSFGHQLFFSRVVPPWLRMIPYKVPDDLAVLNQSVLLFQVNFDQTPADALYHIALGKVVLGAVADAERDFITLTQQSAESFQPYLRVGELMMLRKDWLSAAKYSAEGIRKCPPNLRVATVGDVAAKFYRSGELVLAVELYRLGLSYGFNADLGTSLAYILATSRVDAVRNGAEALQLAEQAARFAPNSPITLNALAVAYAEVGRFKEAVTAADRALANAQLEGNTFAAQVSSERLAAFKAGKPWRE